MLQSNKPHQVLRCILSYHSREKPRCSWEKNYRTNTKGLPVDKNIVRLLKSRRQRNDAFGFLRAKDFQVRILCLGKLSIKSEGRIYFLRNCVSENIILQITFLRSTYSRMYSLFQKKGGAGCPRERKTKI